MVASAATAASGLPPIGVAVPTHRYRHHTFAPDDSTQRHATGNTLGGTHDIGLHSPMLDGPPSARAPHAGLDFIGNQQDPVAVTQLAQPREEAVRRHDIAAFTLNRLYQDGRDIFGRRNRFEDYLLQIVDDRLSVICVAWLRGQCRSIGIGVRNMGDALDRHEATPLGRPCWP